MDSSFKLNGFDIRFSKVDEGLLINAEDSSTGQIFSKALSEETATALTDSFFDVNSIFQLFNDYFSKKPENVELSMTNDGKLTYGFLISLGSVTKKMTFTIPLERQEIQPLNKLERLINKLSDKVSQLEKEFQAKTNNSNNQDSEKLVKNDKESSKAFEKVIMEKLEKMEQLLAKTVEKVEALEDRIASFDEINSTLTSNHALTMSRVTELEGSITQISERAEEISNMNNERCQALEKLILKKSEEAMTEFKKKIKGLKSKSQASFWKFDPNCQGADKFDLSNNNQTAISKQSTSLPIYSANPLSKLEKQQFTFLIEGSETMVGVSSTMGLAQNYCVRYAGTFGYYSSGFIWKNGSYSELAGSAFCKGDKISFVVDLKTGEVSVSLNETLKCIHILPKQEIEKYDYYPFVYTNGIKGGATFI